MPEWKVGDRIENRYEIHQILGGGMGVIYICYDHESGYPYALKTFQDRYLQSQQTGILDSCLSSIHVVLPQEIKNGTFRKKQL